MREIPAGVDKEFLAWFRERTEATWAEYQASTVEDYVRQENDGIDWFTWLPGTRWSGGLTEYDIVRAEKRWDVAFPPDFRLFLRYLHTTTPKMQRLGYDESTEHPGEFRAGMSDVPSSFYNWKDKPESLQGAFGWLLKGILFDVERAELWRPSWGNKPATPEARLQRVRELVRAAPKLIPVYGHRYLLAHPCQPGNPILSIWQTDVVMYAPNLRSYLLYEFADLVGLDRKRVEEEVISEIESKESQYASIPFWGDLYAKP